MSQARHFVMPIAMWLALFVGCTSPTLPEPISPSTATFPSPNPASETSEDAVVSGMPHCPGLTNLHAPLKFDWPDIEAAFEKLAEYNWGYYSCAISQPELVTFLKQNMSKSPYVWRTVNEVEHSGGQLTLYYEPFSITFMYVWMLPKPDTQTSYLIMARGNPGMPQTWECSQLLPGSRHVVIPGSRPGVWSE